MAPNVLQAVRTLWNTPEFTIIAIVVITLAIAANTTVFSLINSILFRSLPYKNPGQLVLVTEVPRDGPSQIGCFSYPQYKMMLEQNRVFSGLGLRPPERVFLVVELAASGFPVEDPVDFDSITVYAAVPSATVPPKYSESSAMIEVDQVLFAPLVGRSTTALAARHAVRLL